MSQLKGGGGKPKTPTSPTNTPDNLRSEDVVEFVLGLAEGPIVGPSNGNKSIYVGDTVLERQDGGLNFEEFEVKILPGDADPEQLNFKLGGESSNNQVGVSLAQGIPVTRQTQDGNIDAIDVRLVVGSLYRQVSEGNNPGVFDAQFNFRIRYKPVSVTEWSEWVDAAGLQSTSGNPHIPTYNSAWSEDTTLNAGTYTDPVDGKTFSPINWLTGRDWYRAQPSYSAGSGLFIKGKTTSTYVKEYRIPVQRLPEAYQIQVERLSPDSSTGGTGEQYIAEVQWESFQTIDQLPKKYPYTALMHVTARSTDQFTSVPPMTSIQKGLIIRVPTNYDPVTRVYTGIWDGTWKNAWTNNPVWLLYEAIHNDRWGWSAYTPVAWSKYEAYELAQVCDFILPNGKPRYTFNAYITDPMDGREFCRYMAGSFNSVIVDDNNGNVKVLMDKDDTAVAIFGPESIVGDFEYTFTDVNTRFNDITVIFRNPEIDYNEDRRRVKIDAEIEQFGRIPFDFIAVGCTDENEAVRKASRRLVSSTTETEMVNFKTNRRASVLQPYEIILITDPLKGYGQSGRFRSFLGSVVQLREPIYLEAGVTYSIDVQTSSGVISRGVTDVATGWTSTLVLSSDLPAQMEQKAQFSLKDTIGYGLPKPYRVMSIDKSDTDDWSVLAIEVNRLKFAAEDDAEIVGEPVYSFLKSREPASPTNVKVINVSRAAPDGTMLYRARVDFTPPTDPYTTDFTIRYRQVGQVEYQVVPVDGSGTEVELPRSGSWEFEVRSKNLWNQQSLWIPSVPQNILIDKIGVVSGGSIISAVGALNSVKVTVAYPSQTDIRYARLFASATNSSGTAVEVYRGDTTTLMHTGLTGVQSRYYWVKFEDNLGNVGAFTATGGVLASTTRVTNSDLTPGLITADMFASSVRPIEIVTSLPSTGNFEGRIVTLTSDGNLYRYTGGTWNRVVPDVVGAGIETFPTNPTTGNVEGRVVFNTTDGKLYRYHSGAWTAAVPAVDLTGVLTSTQISDQAITATKFASTLKPIEIVGTLPVTGLVAGRTVFLTTDNKLYRYTGSAWTATLAAADLTGQVGGSQIQDAVLTATKFATGVRPIESFATNPTTGNVAGRVVFNTTDGKLYRYSGSAWVASVASGDITGQITNAQVASITASKISDTLAAAQIPGIDSSKIISGTLDVSRIANSSLTADKFDPDTRPIEVRGGLPSTGNFYGRTVMFTGDGKLYRWLSNNTTGTNFWTAAAAATDLTGQLTGSQIADLEATKISGTLTNAQIASIAAAKLTGQITGVQITDNAVTAAKMAANTITANEIATGAITADEIATNAITAVKIFAGAITTGKIAANAVTANEIAAGTITAAEIAANAITAVKIAAGVITGDKLVAGTITSAYIAANSITASKIVVADTTNLILDVNFEDPNKWLYTNGMISFTSPGVLSVLNVPRVAIASSTGTTNQPACTAFYGKTTTDGVMVEGNKKYRLSSKIFYEVGTNARALLIVEWTNADGTSAGTNTNTTFGNYTTGPTAPGGLVDAEVIVTAPSTAAYARFIVQAIFRQDVPSAGYVMFGAPRMHRAVSSELIVDGAIIADKIATNAIIAGKIAAGVITATEIAADAVTAVKILAGSITTAKIAANAVTANEISANAVTANKILAGTITAAQIGVGTVDATRLIVQGENLSPNGYRINNSTDGLSRFIVQAGASIDCPGPNNTSWPNPYAIRITRGSGQGELSVVMHAKPWDTDNTLSHGIAVKAGDQLSFESTMFHQHALGAGVDAVLMKSDLSTYACTAVVGTGMQLSGTTLLLSSGPSNAFNKVSGYFIAPHDGSIYIRLRNNSTVAGSEVYFWDCRTRKRHAGNMIVDGAISADKLAANSVVAGKIAAGTITAAEIAANTITAGKIAAGAITATEIAAGAITASKLVLGNFNNVIPDGDFRDNNFWMNSGTAAANSGVVAMDGGWTYARAFVIAAGVSDIQSAYFPVDLGATYKVVVRIWNNSVGWAGTLQPLLHMPLVGWYSLKHGYNVSLGGTLPTNAIVAPADTTDMTFYITNPTGVSNNANRQWQFRFLANMNQAAFVQVTITRANDASLIVDGSILATKLAANSVTAAKMVAGTITANELATNAVTADKILAGTITGAKIGANQITAANIAGGTITANELGANSVIAAKISVSSLAAISANLGAITGGSLNINNRFVVDAAGVVTISNAASGARLVLTNSLIQVYDANNVLRVRLGVW